METKKHGIVIHTSMNKNKTISLPLLNSNIIKMIRKK